MCGICGILDYNSAEGVNSGALTSMLDTLIHRGPDGQGIYFRAATRLPALGLGHRRLKIIDLSEAGMQPMCNEEGTIWIVFNGEIYNYKEVRQEMEGMGHRFKSHTDTETILHLYEEYGSDCVKYLRGMFAFALWDEKKESLMLARDRVGKKPLLYAHANGRFCFASEFRALLESGNVGKEINFTALDYYLTFGYCPAPLTIYQGIFKLPPAHTLVLENNETLIQRYWNLDYSAKIKISEQDAADELLRLLKEAVKIRLYSDVPLGAFLSGGIDSSTVVALMSELSPDRVKTFSIGFQEKDYSELKFARNVAEKFSTDHHEFIVRPDALEILPLLVEHYGEPYADSSCIPTYYVSRETRRYVTVALNGDGGDELFAGYERYQGMLAADLYQRIPRFMQALINGCARRLPDSGNPRDRLRQFKRFLNGACLPYQERYLKWIGIFDRGLKKELYTDELLGLTADCEPLQFIAPYLGLFGKLPLVDALLYTDTMSYLPGDLLAKVDITSMAHSLEARSPFLDHKLMEFAAGLPAGYKIKGLAKKYILKKAAGSLIPEENISRRKMGFGVPVGAWFRGALKEYLHEALFRDAFFCGRYFKAEALNKMFTLHVEGKADYTFQLWALLMLELWHRRFMR